MKKFIKKYAVSIIGCVLYAALVSIFAGRSLDIDLLADVGVIICVIFGMLFIVAGTIDILHDFIVQVKKTAERRKQK